jgi:hypothetical protein
MVGHSMHDDEHDDLFSRMMTMKMMKMMMMMKMMTTTARARSLPRSPQCSNGDFTQEAAKHSGQARV